MEMFIICIYLTRIIVIEGYEGSHDEILQYEREENERGYHFKYVTSSGQEREETGEIVKVKDNPIIRVRGYYSYSGTDGKQYRVTYKADEEGYEIIDSNELGPGSYTPKNFGQEEPIATLPPIAFRISPAAIASLAGGGLG